MATILGANTLSSAYDVANGVKFEDGDNAKMSRSISGSPTDPEKYTFSCWIKRGNLIEGVILGNYANANFRAKFGFDSNHKLEYYQVNDGSASASVVTTQVFRDTTAWYHIVLAYDSSQGTAADRVKFYVNGTVVSSYSGTSYPAQDLDSRLNQASQTLVIGQDGNDSKDFDGYMCELVLIDGQALDATSFGEFDSDTPTTWKPKDPSSLTFGDDGFYLDFEDSGDLGDDESGNGNDFTESNLAATDQVTDTCTNNFAVMNNLAIHPSSTFTFKEGNLDYATSSSTRGYWVSTIAVSSGKWYWEYKATDNEARTCVGIAGAPARTNNDPESGDHDNVTVYTTINGRISYNSNAATDNYYNSATSSDDIIIGVAVDLTSSTNSIAFSIDGEWVSGDGSKSTNFASVLLQDDFTNVASTINGVYHMIAGDDGGDQDVLGQANFGNPPFSISSGNSDANGYGNFEYAVPSGYYALCTKNLAEYG